MIFDENEIRKAITIMKPGVSYLKSALSPAEETPVDISPLPIPCLTVFGRYSLAPAPMSTSP